MTQKHDNPLGNRHEAYLQHLNGCRDAFPNLEDNQHIHECDTHEYYRMLMNLRQPQSVKNYTRTGFTKIRAPPEVVKVVTGFWQRNRQMKRVVEQWPRGS